MQEQFVLTVAESKRLIACGIKESESVKHALSHGTVIVCTGSTDAYVYEELVGREIDKWRFLTGRHLPSTGIRGSKEPSAELPNLVLRKGQPQEDCDWVEALQELGPDDVIVKGANALNYERRQVGVLIGHPQGGTMGQILGITIARRVKLIHPVGLEKSIPVDLEAAASQLADATRGLGSSSAALWVSPGRIFTEVEALRILCGVQATPIGAGGIGGAEGCVRLLVHGDADQVSAAKEVVGTVVGEPPLLD
jgi:hypothetical protein